MQTTYNRGIIMSTSQFLRRRQFLGQAVFASSLALFGLTTDVFGADKKGKKQRKRRRSKRKKRNRNRPTKVLDLTEDHFEELVGQEFKASSLRRPVKLKLLEVREHDHHTDHTQRPIHIRQEPFSLLFIAPGGEKLESGIHELEHPELGEFNLFLHEVGADLDVKTIHYEVVFN